MHFSDLKLKQYDKVISDCTVVLRNEKNNVKALHRRATAYQELATEDNNYNQV